MTRTVDGRVARAADAAARPRAPAAARRRPAQPRRAARRGRARCSPSAGPRPRSRRSPGGPASASARCTGTSRPAQALHRGRLRRRGRGAVRRVGRRCWPTHPAWDALAHWLRPLRRLRRHKRGMVDGMKPMSARTRRCSAACHDAIFARRRAAARPRAAGRGRRARRRRARRPDPAGRAASAMVNDASPDGRSRRRPRPGCSTACATARPRRAGAERRSARAAVRSPEREGGRHRDARAQVRGRARARRSPVVSGTTPAQASPATSSGGSSGQPSDTFSDHSSIGSASTSVAVELAPASAGASRRCGPGSSASVIRSSARLALGGVERRVHDAEQHGAAVVQRRLERRARDDQPVERGDGQAGRRAGGQRAASSASRSSRGPARGRRRGRSRSGCTTGCRPSVDEREVPDHGRVEQRVELGAVGALPSRAAG